MLCRRYITMLDISSMQMTEMHALWLICDKKQRPAPLAFAK